VSDSSESLTRVLCRRGFNRVHSRDTLALLCCFVSLVVEWTTITSAHEQSVSCSCACCNRMQPLEVGCGHLYYRGEVTVTAGDTREDG